MVRVYRSTHPNTKSGFIHAVIHKNIEGKRVIRQFAGEQDAMDEAEICATRLSEGRTETAGLTRSDRDELETLRKLAYPTPAVLALQEWARANELSEGKVLAAVEAWARSHAAGKAHGEVGLAACVEAFIKSKTAAGKQGERTYRSKLAPLVAEFPGRDIGTITAAELNEYLGRFADAVTRNDHRKRAVALWRWAQVNRRIARGLQLEIELTERAKESATEIGIISAGVWKKLLHWCHGKKPEYLTALVLAGFCGLRADEIHGKRSDRSIRQTWEDIRIPEEFVRVTVAKTNTPAWRMVPLCPAAIAWLRLCPGDHTGLVCDAAALEKLRWHAKRVPFALPENCLRHSYISNRIPVTNGNKPQVASEAGNSVAEIDKRYRVPLTLAEAKAWFSVMP